MNGNAKVDSRLDRLIGWYGNGADGSAPTPAQWRALLERPGDRPITLINFFKMRVDAAYPAGTPDSAVSGETAFARYAGVSVPSVEKVGGKFLLLAPFAFSLLGSEEDWDLVAIGSYPHASALLALLEDVDYRAAYPHRTAALARQKVQACAV